MMRGLFSALRTLKLHCFRNMGHQKLVYMYNTENEMRILIQVSIGADSFDVFTSQDPHSI